MADAPVIPMNGDRPRRRPAAGTRSVLAGADRASGERARRQRRTTPLLADRDEVTAVADRPAKQAPAKTAAAGKAPAETAPAKQAPAKQATAEAPATIAPAEAPATIAPAKKTAARKSTAKKSTAKKSTAKPATAKKTAAKAPAAKAPAAKAPVRKVPAKRATKDAAAKQVPREPLPLSEPARAPEKPPWVLEAERSQGIVGSPGVGEKLELALGIASQVGDMLADALAVGRRRADAEAAVAAALDLLARRLAGEYEVDEFGFDAEFTDAVWMAALRPVYRRWFRVETRGIENVPATGGALIVANHSGTVPVDALMTTVAIHDEHPEHRFLRMLGADLVFQLPFVGRLARQTGSTLATNADAERLLRGGHLVGVWPEGFKGIGKPFSERYKLQRFGRGGFVSAALRTGTPIVPCSIVGAEEIYPLVGDIPALARLLGLPYIPITPFFPLLGPLGAIPLPSKWLIEFGQPLTTAEYGRQAAEDPMLVFDLTDRVRQTIQQTLYSLLVQRRSIFF
jgi:1-acyl-sn-glycerol-3-phosphate acyltransferase